MGFKPLIPVEFYVVGSAVRGETNPNDLDIVGVIPNDTFTFYFGMNHKEFHDAHREEKTPPKLERWREHCRGAQFVLENLFPYRKVDVKFISESMLYEPNRKISLMELEQFK